MRKGQDVTSKPSSELGMVCGRKITVDLAYVPQATCGGNTIYFCTESCLNAFLADPERFYCAHNQPPGQE